MEIAKTVFNYIGILICSSVYSCVNGIYKVYMTLAGARIFQSIQKIWEEMGGDD